MKNENDGMEMKSQTLNNFFNAVDISAFTIGQNIFFLQIFEWLAAINIIYSQRRKTSQELIFNMSSEQFFEELGVTN
jgi:hypothetical protein